MKRVIHACLLALALLVFASTAFAQLANTYWPKFQRDTYNSAQGLFGGTGNEITWTYPAVGQPGIGAIKSAPVIGPDGTTYFTCNDGYVYAVAGDGTFKWSQRIYCSGSSSPAISSSGYVYVGCTQNYLYAFKSDGSLYKKKPLDSNVESSIAIAADGSIYFGCKNGKLYALKADCTTKWSYSAGASIESTPAILSNGYIVFGTNGGKVFSLQSGATSCTVKWTFSAQNTSTEDFVAAPTVGPDGNVYIGSTGGYFYAINGLSGTQAWRTWLLGAIRSSAAVAPDGMMYVGCDNGTLYAVSPTLRDDVWGFATGAAIYSSPALGTDGGVFVGSLDGNVYAINPDGTLRWQYDADTYIYSSPAIGPAGALIIGTDSGRLLCFAADDTPPGAPTVTDTGAYTSILDRLTGTWSAVDAESGIFSYEYCIGTAPGADDVAPWFNVGGQTTHTRTGLALVDKQTYYITVRAINGAGITGPEASSDGIIADATPPAVPQVTDDGLFSSNTTSLHASWTSNDPESGVAGYQYSIGTAPGATNVLGWTDAGAATSVTKTGLSLQTGTTYYINVKALNTGGIYSAVGSSNGITVDATPPTIPVVLDAGQFISSATSIYASWSCADNESGVTKFEYSVGTTPGGTQVLAWTNAGTSVQVTISSLSLTNGGIYYVNVRATNGAGLTSSVGSTDGVTVDTTAPDAPVVTDDGAYTASTTELHATWTASDPQSGIKSYKYAIGTTAGGTNIVNWTDVGTNTSVTRSGLSLQDKQVYYISVIAVNGANAQSQAGVSNGITVDATPPTKPVVTDDGDYTIDKTQIHATWTSTDAESGIDRFEYAVGTAAGGTDVVNWTSVGTSTSVTKTGLNLQDGNTYFVSVRAYNKVGLISQVGSSNGISVDSVMPPAPTVTDDGQFTSSGSSLHMTWTVVTSPSGIASYEYSIGTSAGGTNIKNWTNVGNVVEATATGLSLVDGSTYYINVRARNTLNREGFVGSSDGITIDLTPPSKPTVNDGGAFNGTATALSASWSSEDLQSGIAKYEYAVGTTPGGTNTRNWTSAGTETTMVIDSLLLIDGGTYYISVRAVNGAGATSEVSTSDGITVDLTPPSRPSVADDGQYTTNGTQLHATWSASDAQSGISGYEVSVGTAAGSADVLDWTPAGNVTDFIISGLDLQSGASYFINVRALNGAGLVSEVGSSDGIYVESTPPTTPEVDDGTDYTTSLTTLSATWSSSDPETGVSKYEYSIGTAPALDDIVGWTDVALAVSVTRNDLVLESGTTYYINVRATNGIGLVSEVGSSDGVTVDTTAPGLPTVIDDGKFTANSTQLHVVFECIDDESGIACFEYAVGTSVEGVDILDWTTGGPETDIVIPELALQDGATYYISARAINGAGIMGEVGVSDGITVDSTPPTAVTVQDDGAYTSFSDRLHGKWSATDPESGIGGYRYCIGTAPGLNNAADWLNVGNVKEHTRDGLSLVAGQLYYITVVAINGAGGESAPVSSDGILLDLTPPSKPVVTDNGVYWGYKSSMFGSWQSSDPESGIAEYQVSIGSSPGTTDVAPWTSVGDKTSHTLTGLTLVDGATYYINVKAKNGGGGWSEVGSSDGVLIDSTPPTTPVVVDDGDFTAVLDSLHATWHSEDPESGIAEYVYCIGTSPGATDVKPWTSAGLSEDVTVTGIQLDPVLRYYFSVKARSNSGAWSAVSASDGIGFSSGAAIWSRFRNDNCSLGRGLFPATTVNDLVWSITTPGYIESSPAIATDGTTYIGSGDGKLYAVTQNGTLRWTYNAGASIDSSPAIAPDGKIVVGCNNGKLYCITPSGELVWTYTAGGAVRSSALICDGIAYVGSDDMFLHAVNMETGAVVWKYGTGGGVWSSPSVDKSNVVYVASQDSYLYAINSGGILKWRFKTGSSIIGSPAVAADGTIYIGSGDGNIYAVKSDGTLKWKKMIAQPVNSSPAIGLDGKVYFGSGFDGGDGKVYAYNPDGTEAWRVELRGGGVHSSPAVDPNGMVYVGSSDRCVYAFNPDGSLRWKYVTGDSVISSPALGADSSVVFGSYDGKIYCLRDVTSKDLTPPTKPVVSVPGSKLLVGNPFSASWTSSDPESMVAEYVYCIGTEPGLADVAGWTSTGIETSVVLDDVVLQLGQTYYISVKARNPAQRWSEVGVSEGVTYVDGGPMDTIGQLKSLTDGSMASLESKIVTAVFSDCFFIQELDRSSGLRCIAPDMGFQINDLVTVEGTVNTVCGEKVLVMGPLATAGVVGTASPVSPLGMPGKAVGLAGLSPLGLKVTIWGKVETAVDGLFTLNCGSNAVQVRCTGCVVSAGDVVSATGVLCKETVDDQPVTVLRVTSVENVVLQQ